MVRYVVKKRKTNKITVNKLKDKVWKEFSQHIRRKYADWKGDVQCVTCQTWLREFEYKGISLPGWKSAQAGHFIPGRHNSILFDERHVYPQCYRCNVILHGNLINYYPFMIKTQGQRVINELKKLDKVNKQFTTTELEVLLEKYKKLNVST
jgi:hypothetical protein